ncbi:dienelactone hydrolase family protein [Burkholderia gladioli pv. gladioli]|uniref:Carboxymethylenebutenolidase n=1 Tax=Burkholderia gladioli TaxID=28095 RepID=A0A095G1F0_BURGA|nr:dienelactone hydrolase family protein [Burkholderia gladioli]AJW99420.1 carboxymethylenebutenolidase [Burkholderia gladioli]ASD79976.1 carboxymethylenebutenolidase [Burkholderia gladioli pv. gladioli]AWY54778.1 carboxymethylenebutenolidase [Burkholderia gladioli pv. gladioli]KGC11207.1 carboxymethylenebutenolidase [Burkholderia gladioli]MDJ1164236.1 dienelactone hydrolase family protein [Burkholderia gladioli pv. gladioli]
MQFNASLSVPDGNIGLYTKGRAGEDVGAVVVLQEIFGVNANIRSTVDRLAGLGYRAIAPDLYWRQRAGVDLAADDPDNREQAMMLAQRYREAIGINMADLAALVSHLRTIHRKVGVVGYCLGGRLAFQSWLQFNVDAVVSYYGVGIENLLSEISDQRTPLLLHMGAEDPLNPPAAQNAIAEAVDGLPNATMETYPGVGHAFARLNGASYVASAATRADASTFSFLAKHLGNTA